MVQSHLPTQSSRVNRGLGDTETGALVTVPTLFVLKWCVTVTKRYKSALGDAGDRITQAPQVGC